MKKILFALMCASALAILTGCSNEKELEESAVSVVNEIVEENLGPIVRAAGGTLVKCTKVDLTEKISDTKWKGKAYFENGKEIDCVVTDLDDQIYVEIDFATLK